MYKDPWKEAHRERCKELKRLNYHKHKDEISQRRKQKVLNSKNGRMCSDCGIDIHERDGHSVRCIPCAKTYRKENGVRRLNIWTKEHPEEKKEINKRSYLRNKKKCLKRSCDWPKKNRDRYNYLRRERYKKTKERRRIKLSGKRAIKNGARGSHTITEWLEVKRQSSMCSMCGQFVGCEDMSLDHIIPFCKGGTNWIWNVQSLCRSCNTQKRGYLPPWITETYLKEKHEERMRFLRKEKT